MAEGFVKVEILGLPELEKTLTDEGPKMAKRWLRQMERKAGKIWQEEIEARAPKGETGFLADNIKIKTHYERSDQEMVMQVGPTSEAYYGLFQEFGTRDVEGTDKNGKHFHHPAQAAQPFMRPAYESKKDEVLEAFVSEARDRLEDMKQQ
jgi:HK97 gp10 family phage protein